jgi:hypothetical protein
MVARRRVYPYAHTSHDKRITALVNGHEFPNPYIGGNQAGTGGEPESRSTEFLHYLRPGTLVPRPSYYEELPAVDRAGNSSTEQTYTNAVHVLLMS